MIQMIVQQLLRFAVTIAVSLLGSQLLGLEVHEQCTRSMRANSSRHSFSSRGNPSSSSASSRPGGGIPVWIPGWEMWNLPNARRFRHSFGNFLLLFQEQLFLQRKELLEHVENHAQLGACLHAFLGEMNTISSRTSRSRCHRNNISLRLPAIMMQCTTHTLQSKTMDRSLRIAFGLSLIVSLLVAVRNPQLLNGRRLQASSVQGVTIDEQFIRTSFDKVPRLCNSPYGTITHRSKGAGGDWTKPSSWLENSVPGAGSRVQILAGSTITYDARSDAVVGCIEIQDGGRLQFSTQTDTKLVLDDGIYVLPGATAGGELIIGSEQSPIPFDKNVEIIFADTALKTAKDPQQYGKGILVWGRATMVGSKKSPAFARVGGDLAKGQTTVELLESPIGWRAGDSLVLPDSAQQLFQEKAEKLEELVIASVSGKRVTLTKPLQHAHPCARDSDGTMTRHPGTNEFLCPHVANLSRNIVIRSAHTGDPFIWNIYSPTGHSRDFSVAQPSPSPRGHAMFFHRADVDVRYVQLKDMGRTSFAPLDSTTFDAAGNASRIGTNQIGRYAIHLHHVWGVAVGHATGRQFTLIGNSVSGGPKWCIAVHDSHYGLVQENVVYRCNGGGIVTEDGSESFNVIERNIAIKTESGESGASKNRPDLRDAMTGGSGGGSEGAGFWFHGMQNTVRNNVSANARIGFQFAVAARGFSVRVPARPGADPASSPLQAVESLPSIELRNNEAYANPGDGLGIWNTNRDLHTATDTAVWHNAIGAYQGRVFAEQRSSITLDGFTSRHDLARSLSNDASLEELTGIQNSAQYVHSLVLKRGDIQGARYGIHNGGTGAADTLVKDSTFANIVNIEVSPFRHFKFRTYEFRNLTFKKIPNVPFKTIVYTLSSSEGESTSLFNPQKPDQLMKYTKVVGPSRVLVFDYQGILGKNFEVFTEAQGPAVILPYQNAQPSDLHIGSPEPGLSTQKAWDTYGIAQLGQIAWCNDSSTYPEVGTYACPFTGNTFPPPRLGPPRAVIVWPNSFTSIGNVSSLRLKAWATGNLSTAYKNCASLDNGPAVCGGVQTDNNKNSYGQLSNSGIDTAFASLKDGSHTLSMWLTDKAGKELSGSRHTTSFVTGDEPPRLAITAPSTPFVDGPDVTVQFEAKGSLIKNGARYIHLQLNDSPEITNIGLSETSYVFAGLLRGTHTVRGYLAGADHRKIAGTDVSVTFTTRQGTVPTGGVKPPTGGTTGGSTPGSSNSAPVVDVGPDLTITLPQTASIEATVTDDGLPVPPGKLTLLWSKNSGGGTVTFSDRSQAKTIATFDRTGSFRLQLRVDDGEKVSYGRLNVQVLPPGDSVGTPSAAFCFQIKLKNREQKGQGNDLSKAIVRIDNATGTKILERIVSVPVSGKIEFTELNSLPSSPSYTVTVHPRGYVPMISPPLSLPLSAGTCLAMPQTAFGDLDEDRDVDLSDLVTAIRHMRLKDNDVITEAFKGAANFMLSHLVEMIRFYVQSQQ